MKNAFSLFSKNKVVKLSIPNFIKSQPSIEVWIPKTNDEIEEWANHEGLLESDKSLVLGFDAEWKPSFTKTQNKVALLQLAGKHSVALIQIRNFVNNGGDINLKVVKHILGSTSILKVGVGVQADLEKFHQDYQVPYNSYCDIGEVARHFHGSDLPNGASLAKLAQFYLGTTLNKSSSVCMSNWERHSLSDQQIQYAAYDAKVGRDIYIELENKGAFTAEFEVAVRKSILKSASMGCRVSIKKAFAIARLSDVLVNYFGKMLQEEYKTPFMSKDVTDRRLVLQSYLSRFGLVFSFAMAPMLNLNNNEIMITTTTTTYTVPTTTATTTATHSVIRDHDNPLIDKSTVMFDSSNGRIITTSTSLCRITDKKKCSVRQLIHARVVVSGRVLSEGVGSSRTESTTKACETAYKELLYVQSTVPKSELIKSVIGKSSLPTALRLYLESKPLFVNGELLSAAGAEEAVDLLESS